MHFFFLNKVGSNTPYDQLGNGQNHLPYGQMGGGQFGELVA
jgi:hypothetical protein